MTTETLQYIKFSILIAAAFCGGVAVIGTYLWAMKALIAFVPAGILTFLAACVLFLPLVTLAIYGLVRLEEHERKLKENLK